MDWKLEKSAVAGSRQAGLKRPKVKYSSFNEANRAKPRRILYKLYKSQKGRIFPIVSTIYIYACWQQQQLLDNIAPEIEVTCSFPINLHARFNQQYIYPSIYRLAEWPCVALKFPLYLFTFLFIILPLQFFY